MNEHFQEYEKVREEVGENTYQKIEEFLTVNPQYLLSDVYYKEEVWKEFESWMKTVS